MIVDIIGTDTIFGVVNITGSGAVDFDFSDTITGTSSVSGIGAVIYRDSVIILGESILTDNLSLVDSLLVIGQANVSSPVAGVIYSGAATFYGQATLTFEEFEPIIGQTLMTAFADVVKAPTVCACVCEQPKNYRMGSLLDSQDLDISLSNPVGPFDPVCISYTLHQVVKGCVSKQMGLSRKPGHDAVGHYYVSGMIGDCGQPGLWLVRWRYQSSFGGPFYEKDCYFYLVDSVLCPVPGDTLVRVRKYGWD